VGFDVIPQTAEEMNIPLKQIANVLIVSILMAAAWYILMIVGISISAPTEIRQSGAVPVADAMAFSFNSPIFGKILIGGALCGILTSWNGFIMGATRVLFAMGRAKMIPAVFAKLHPKYNSPTAAILLVGLISCLSPLLGKNALVWFVNASAFGTVIAYLLVSISFISLRKREPNLERPFKVSSWRFVGYGAVIISLIFISLYLPIGPGSLVWPYEWGIVFAWMIVGIILAIWAKVSYGDISNAEREFLIFGKDYARKEILSKKER